MRIVDRLGTGEPCFSFEFFPPKTEAGERKVDVLEFIEIAKAAGLDPLELLRRALR